MNKNIILCGVGGQGTILASRLIATAAMNREIPIKTAETIGMAQRGGSVFSHLRLGEGTNSPLIGKGEVDLAVKSGADVYITGDINHHDGIDAVEKGIAVIDAGHYGVEKIFIPYMKEYLEREVPSIRIVSCDQGMPYNET